MASAPPQNSGGQFRYSNPAIETTLMLGGAFGMRLRQTEGFVSSVIDLMGLDVRAPDHATLSRRAQKQSARAVNQTKPIA